MIENRTPRFAITRIVIGYDLRWPAVIIQRPIQRPIQAHTEIVTMRPDSELFIRPVSFFFRLQAIFHALMSVSLS